MELLTLPLPSFVPIELEDHTVPHFKAPVNGKVEFLGLEGAGNFTYQTSIVNLDF